MVVYPRFLRVINLLTVVHRLRRSGVAGGGGLWAGVGLAARVGGFFRLRRDCGIALSFQCTRICPRLSIRLAARDTPVERDVAGLVGD